MRVYYLAELYHNSGDLIILREMMLSTGSKTGIIGADIAKNITRSESDASGRFRYRERENEEILRSV
jgi:hypothetical protein